MAPFAGLLLVDKPKGWTSHDVVAVVRRSLPKGTKVGHSGTLDPMATGLLILLVGKATKAAASYQGLPKTYSGTMRFGVETETGDLEGRVTRERPVPEISAGDLRAALANKLGELEITVPRYSAVKHKGKPLYSYARKGIETPVMRRLCRLYEWELTAWEPPEASFRLRCSSGTYVRSLAVLLGEEFGCGATLSSLRREEVGSFHVDAAIQEEGLKDCRTAISALPSAEPREGGS